MERKDVPGWAGVQVSKDGVAWLISNGRATPIAQRHKGVVTVVFQTAMGPVSKSASVKTLIGLAWADEPPAETPTAKKRKGSKAEPEVVVYTPSDEEDKQPD